MQPHDEARIPSTLVDGCVKGKYLRETIKILEDELTLLKKIKQVRKEIDTDVRIAVKHFTNIDIDVVIDYVLDSIDELIESEEE